MFYAGIDMLFSILFPILFLVVLGMILYTIIGNISIIPARSRTTTNSTYFSFKPYIYSFRKVVNTH